MFFYAVGCGFLASCGGYQPNPPVEVPDPVVMSEEELAGGGGDGGDGGCCGGHSHGEGHSHASPAKGWFATGRVVSPPPAPEPKGPVENALVQVSDFPIVKRSLDELEKNFRSDGGTPFQLIEIKNLVKEDQKIEFVFGRTATLMVTWLVEVSGPKNQRTLDREIKLESRPQNLLVSGIGIRNRYYDREVIPSRNADLNSEFELERNSTMRVAFYARLEGSHPRNTSERVTLNIPDDQGKVEVKHTTRTETIKSAQVSGSAGLTIYIVNKDGTKTCVYRS